MYMRYSRSKLAEAHCLAWAVLIALVLFNCCSASANDMQSVFDLFQKLCEPRLTSHQDTLDRARANGLERIEIPDHPHLKKLMSDDPDIQRLYGEIQRQQQLFRTKLQGSEIFILIQIFWIPPYVKEFSVSIDLFDFVRVHDDVQQRLEKWMGRPFLMNSQTHKGSSVDQWLDLDERIGMAAQFMLVRQPLKSRSAKETGFGGTIISASVEIGE